MALKETVIPKWKKKGESDLLPIDSAKTIQAASAAASLHIYKHLFIKEKRGAPGELFAKSKRTTNIGSLSTENPNTKSLGGLPEKRGQMASMTERFSRSSSRLALHTRFQFFATWLKKSS